MSCCLFPPVEGDLFHLSFVCTVAAPGTIDVTSDAVAGRFFRRLLWVTSTQAMNGVVLKLATVPLTEPFALPLGVLFPVFRTLPPLLPFQFRLTGLPSDVLAPDPSITLILEEFPNARHQ